MSLNPNARPSLKRWFSPTCNEWNVRQPRRLLDVAGNVVPVSARHPGVGQHDIGRCGVEALDGLVAVADADDADVLIREDQVHDALDGHALVGEQESGHAHRFLMRLGFARSR